VRACIATAAGSALPFQQGEIWRFEGMLFFLLNQLLKIVTV
jgi:hypothetical protein